MTDFWDLGFDEFGGGAEWGGADAAAPTATAGAGGAADVAVADALGAASFPANDAVVILLDASQHMRQDMNDQDRQRFFADEEPNPSKKCTYLVYALSLVETFLQQKIINRPGDFVGLLLYGSRVAQNNRDFKHIYTVFPCSAISAQHVKRVRMLIEQLEQQGAAAAAAQTSSFEKDIGSVPANTVKFKDAVKCASASLVQDVRSKKFAKRIFIFTNCDDPSFGDDDVRKELVTCFQDCADWQQTIDLFAIAVGYEPSQHPNGFDYAKFYDSVIELDTDPEEREMITRDKFGELKSKLRAKSTTMRPLQSTKWTLGADGPQIAIKLYSLIMPAKKQAARALDAATNELLTSVTSWLCEATGSVLEPHQILSYLPHGGQDVVFGGDDLRAFKNFGDAGMKLIGFKPRQQLRDDHNVRAPYFIYSDEKRIKGSTAAFTALLYECANRDLFALCSFVYRAKASGPRFCALLPQLEERDEETGAQITPPGFHVIVLPYADDIRDLSFAPAATADEGCVAAAQNLIKKLPLREIPTDIPNPSLQHHYRMLQAAALAEPLPDNVEDLTLPDTQGMIDKEKKHHLFSNFAKAVAACTQHITEDIRKNAPPSTATSKRGRGAAVAGGGARKKARIDAPSDDAVRAACDSGSFKGLTVVALKAYLVAKGASTTGRKADLIARVKSLQ